MTFLHDAIHIDTALRRLRENLAEARWDEDDEAETDISREIARLEMLAGYGEMYDLPF